MNSRDRMERVRPARPGRRGPPVSLPAARPRTLVVARGADARAGAAGVACGGTCGRCRPAPARTLTGTQSISASTLKNKNAGCPFVRPVKEYLCMYTSRTACSVDPIFSGIAMALPRLQPRAACPPRTASCFCTCSSSPGPSCATCLRTDARTASTQLSPDRTSSTHLARGRTCAARWTALEVVLRGGAETVLLGRTKQSEKIEVLPDAQAKSTVATEQRAARRRCESIASRHRHEKRLHTTTCKRTSSTVSLL